MANNNPRSSKARKLIAAVALAGAMAGAGVVTSTLLASPASAAKTSGGTISCAASVHYLARC